MFETGESEGSNDKLSCWLDVCKYFTLQSCFIKYELGIANGTAKLDLKIVV